MNNAANWMDDKREDESMSEFVQRLHDERHGPACGCLGNPGNRRSKMPLPGFQILDSVPEGKRMEITAEMRYE